MSRLSILTGLVALLIGAAAIWFLVMSDPPAPEPVTVLAPDEEQAATAPADLATEHIQGGVYAGRVVDEDGRGIRDARVLLISYGTGAMDMTTAGQGADDAPIARIGNHKIAGEGISDEGGGFRIAADSQSLITRVLAYRQGYFLDVAEVTRPRNDVLLTLRPAGRVIGTVVDNDTGDPVPRAVVDIYLQQKVTPIPESAQGGGYTPFKRERTEMSWLVTLGRFISKDLGKRIWDVADSGSETIRLYTDDNGRFEFGPIDDSVQLEFVITHSRYMWFDFDTQGGTKTPRRTVVHPGDTVERTFRLRRGKHISGQVVDENGKGLPEVKVKVQSISAYYRHWWYRFKWRRTTTDAQGRFRVDGLAVGAQAVEFEHPSFKSKTTSVKAGTEDLLVVADRYGALSGSIEGLASGPKGRHVTVYFESTEETPTFERRMERSVPVDASNSFLVQRVPPGRYRVWIKAGRHSSVPVELELEALKTLTERFEVGAGGALSLRVIDENGGLVDPASARLVEVSGEKTAALGTFVSREGEFDIDDVAPGRYHLVINAPGRIPARTEDFEVRRDRTTTLPPVTVNSWSYLQFGQPTDSSGRPAQISGRFVLEFRKAGGTFERLFNAGAEKSVEPGRYEIRAHTDDMEFEGSVEVAPGETRKVTITLTPKP